MIKYVFHKEKLNAVDTVYEKLILSFSRAFFLYLTWRNLKGLELANLTEPNTKYLQLGIYMIKKY